MTQVNALLVTTENMGDHARVVRTAIEPHSFETVEEFMKRVLRLGKNSPEPATAVIELRYIEDATF